MTVLPGGGGYGIPGGHLEYDELPDVAIERELKEELGLCAGQYRDLSQVKFWKESGGDRVILGYQGILEDETAIILQPEEVESVVWVEYLDIVEGRVSSEAYNEFLLELFQVS